MGGGRTPRMTIAMPNDSGNVKKSYSSDSMLIVRAKNHRNLYVKESTYVKIGWEVNTTIE